VKPPLACPKPRHARSRCAADRPHPVRVHDPPSHRVPGADDRAGGWPRGAGSARADERQPGDAGRGSEVGSGCSGCADSGQRGSRPRALRPTCWSSACAPRVWAI